MRFAIVVLFGLGLLTFSSCNKPHQPVVNNAQSTAEPDVASGGDSTEGDNNHAGHEYEQTGEHESHGNAHPDRHVSADTHEGKESGHRSHHQGNEDHGQSADHHASQNPEHITVGDKVPDFECTIDGEKLTLRDLQKNTSITEDGTLVLTFWCSFCHSCRHVEHALDALAKQYQGQVGIIAVDSSAGETTEGVAEFAKQRELTLPIALDETGAAAAIFGARVTTTTVVIDKSGVLRYRGQFVDEDHVFAHEALQAVLAGEDVPVSETRQKG